MKEPQEQLITSDEKRDESSKNKLFYQACTEGNLEVVKNLMADQRIDVNQADKNGRTPFYVACSEGHEAVVKLLMRDPRIDVNELNKQTDDGTTPFHVACSRGQAKVVELLLADQRIDVNRPDNVYGLTPFCIACLRGQTKVVKLLLADERADVDQKADDGSTPLHLACAHKLVAIAKLIIAHKVDAYLKKNPLIYEKILANQTNEAYLKTLVESISSEYALLETAPSWAVSKKSINGDRPYGFFITCVTSYRLAASDYFSLMRLYEAGYFTLPPEGPGPTAEPEKPLAQADIGAIEPVTEGVQSLELETVAAPKRLYPDEKARSFFKISSALPTELQMLLAWRLTGSTRQFVPDDMVAKSLIAHLSAPLSPSFPPPPPSIGQSPNGS